MRLAIVATIVAAAATLAAAQESLEYPLGPGKIALSNGAKPAKRRVDFQAQWSRAFAMPYNPAAVRSTVRFAGADGQGSGVIDLRADRWRGLPKAKGYRYLDSQQTAGGIREVLIKRRKQGGSIRIRGGGTNWQFRMSGPQNSVEVTVSVGAARWCAMFPGPLAARGRRYQGATQTAPTACPCDDFDGTFEAIQKLVFERHGCTQAICHGASPGEGKLDLRPEFAYASLVDKVADASPLKRVEPGEQARSFLWLKLAEGLGLVDVPGSPMPNGLPPISTDELEAVRKWIRAGAPQTGIVPETDRLLASCLPPPDPIKIRRPPVPAVNEGIQLHAPPWDIAANGEDEVCYATYYDYTAQIPAEFQAPCPDYWGGPSKMCFFWNGDELTQDPNSHHSIIHLYKGEWDVRDPRFEQPYCHGGPLDGQACTPGNRGVPPPAGSDCGDLPNGRPAPCRLDDGFGPWACRGGALHGQPCNPKGFGVAAPAGAECGADSACAGKVVSRVACVGYGPPDYGFSLDGGGTENAPSIGGSQQTILKNIAPPGVFGMFPTSGIIVWNSHAFNLSPQPTTNEQYFNIFFANPENRLYPIRGVFDANDIFVQDVPPFERRTYCRTVTFQKGTRLYEFSSHMHKRGTRFKVWGPGIDRSCSSAAGFCGEDAAEPILDTVDYSDPDRRRYEPQYALDSDDPVARRFKFCATYDNGATDPALVKRRSTSPDPPPPIPAGTIGGACAASETFCLAGPKKGQPCNGDDRVCDSVPSVPDGVCDACRLRGGVTTEDEMFILLGLYYCVPGTPCETTGYTN